MYGATPEHVSWPCAILAAALGLAAMLGGVVSFSTSSEDTRAVLVHSYDDAVDYWNAAGESQFTGVTCAIANVTGSGNYVLQADTTDDPLLDSNKKELHEYKPLSYLHTGSITPGLKWNTEGVYAADITLICQGGAAMSSSTLVIPQVDFFKTEIKGRANQKQCMYQQKGSYKDNHCEVYSKAKEICMKVSVVDGKWALNTTWGGFGCHASSLWSAVTYKQVQGKDVSFGHGKPPLGALDFTELQVRVRSGVDPWVTAEELTDDRLDFGASAQDEFILGTILEIIGVFLLAPLLYRAWWEYQYKQERKDRARAHLTGRSLVEEGDYEVEDNYTNPLHGAMPAVPMTSYNDEPPTMASSFGGTRGIGMGRTQRPGL